MRFHNTPIAGVLLVEPDFHRDERGFFARLNCVEEFATAGVSFHPRQTSMSHNALSHTLRGMHYCLEPEAKLVRCARGRALDVVFDIRSASPSRGVSFSIELSADNGLGLFIPAGPAHGFQTLEPATDMLYQIDRIYRPGFDAGLRWDDPAFAFNWPAAPAVISARDMQWPDFSFD